MAKKNPDMDAPVQPAEALPQARAAVPRTARDKSGVYIYIGPNIKGLLQTGTIYRGSREEAFERARDAIAKHPLVKSLIVSGEALPDARIKVRTPGNVLYANYQKLAGK